MLKLYNQYGVLKASFEPDDSSEQIVELQSDNELSLSFTMYECVVFEVNDYIDFEGTRFWVLEQYYPDQTSTVEWEYDVSLYGVESIVQRYLVLQLSNGEYEPIFSYTATAQGHMELIVAALNDGMGTTDWKVGEVVSTDYIVIDYNCTYGNTALSDLASEAGTEFWFENGMTINLTQAEHSEEITLAYGNGLLDLYREKADNVAFFTRFIPIGSSRNIVYDDYGYTRLQLPDKSKYVDIDVDTYGVIHYAETDAFSDIYPRYTGTVSSVRSEECYDDDGEIFYVYYITDDSLPFDPNDYMMDGLVINITFQSGDLNGRDFEVNYNSTTKEFEIINQYPYDDSTIQLPGSLLMDVGDTYIPWNLSMPSEYYPSAEAEYEEKVNEFIEENLKDIGIYKGTTDYVELEKRDVILTIGQRIRLESTKYFPSTGYRLSRITKLTRNVNYPKTIDIEVSDVLSTGTIDKINDDLTEIKNYTEQAVSDLPDVIKSWESTLAADTNLYSAKKSVKEFLSKLNNDTAQGFISFLKGISLGDYILGESGATIDYQGNAELQTAIVRELLSSTKFVDGFTGEGWKVWIDQLTGLSNLTIDKATIRQSLVAFELLIEKVRSVGGQLVVSSANGKIKSVETDEDEENYIITFEDTNTFEEHDLMRCATFSGDIKGYWVEVSESSSEGIVVAISEFEGETPAVGDECVLMGNTENLLRQNLILIAATEDGQPRIDVLDGVKEKNFNDSLRVRLGSLDGITDTTFPLDHQPSGYGLYGDNVFLKGTFILSTGEDILTQFSVLEGTIQSSVEALKQDVADDTSYLSNATFGDGLNDWETDNHATLFTLADRWLWINGAPYSNKTDYAGVKTDDGRTTVYIKNNYILQKNENFRIIPSYDDKNSDGESLASAIYLVFYYKVKTAGTLTIGFENVDQEGFEAFDTFSYEGDLEAGDSYTTFKHSGLWNGSGDFKLSFTGEINLYMLILSTDAAEALAYKYKTLFEQSEKLIKIAAQNFDEDGNVTQESGILTSASGNQLYAFDADGNMISLIDQTAASIKIKAANIALEGLVTANENFKILEDGSIEANKGSFAGYIKTRFLYIDDCDADSVEREYNNYSEDWLELKDDLTLRVDVGIDGALDGTNILLPSDERYIGSRVILWNGCTPPYTRTPGSIRFSSLRCYDNSPIMGFSSNASPDNIVDWSDPSGVRWINGLIELIGVPQNYSNESQTCHWCVIAFNAVSYELLQ